MTNSKLLSLANADKDFGRHIKASIIKKYPESVNRMGTDKLRKWISTPITARELEFYVQTDSFITNKSKIEMLADRFASRFIAPAAIESVPNIETKNNRYSDAMRHFNKILSIRNANIQMEQMTPMYMSMSR